MGCCLNNKSIKVKEGPEEFKEKYNVDIKLEEKDGIKILYPDIKLEIIHVKVIDSTMPASR